MKPKINLIISILFVTLTGISCDRPICKNENPVFDKYEIISVEYNSELVNQINNIGQKNLSYWFDSYTKKNENEYIIVDIQNDSFCAKAMILVNDWKKLEGIKETKGKGYVGAKLKGLTFNIENESDTIRLIYTDITRIVD